MRNVKILQNLQELPGSTVNVSKQSFHRCEDWDVENATTTGVWYVYETDGTGDKIPIVRLCWNDTFMNNHWLDIFSSCYMFEEPICENSGFWDGPQEFCQDIQLNPMPRTMYFILVSAATENTTGEFTIAIEVVEANSVPTSEESEKRSMLILFVSIPVAFLFLFVYICLFKHFKKRNTPAMES